MSLEGAQKVGIVALVAAAVIVLVAWNKLPMVRDGVSLLWADLLKQQGG